jgi:transposase
MGKLKRMDQVKDIIKTYVATKSLKATARQLRISKNTVREYVRRGKLADGDLSALLKLSDEDFLSVFYESADKKVNEREALFITKVDDWIKELRRVGVTKYLLWQEYRLEHPEGFGYSRFCELLRQHIGQRDLTLAMTHSAGEVMQVDFAGKKLRWIDIHTGEVHDCEVLVAVMPHSQYTFAIALPSQKTADFIAGLNAALLFFGKMSQIILSDNLKAYVIRADRYEPQFNDLCVQLAAHYGIHLQATRAAKPKDKASVENMVSTVYTRIYAPLRNEIYHSEAELNAAIVQQLDKHNSLPYQKKEGTRKSIFDTYELPKMRDLPSELFEIKKTTIAKAQRNYHVYLGEEKNYYSLPYRYVGKKTTIVYTHKIVEIYVGNQRVAIHKRLQTERTYQYQTAPKHMPKSHQEWKKSEGYDAPYFLKMGLKIGQATHWAMAQILSGKSHQSQTYKSCQGVLHLGKKHGNARLERAAARCQKVDKVTYTMLMRILRHNLDDDETEQDTLFTPPTHENIRGAEAYQ